jgi:hypothetical protein
VNEKRLRQADEAAAPHLAAGERIEICAYANIGRVSLKRRAATAAVAVAATGGLLVVSVRPRKAYLVMTSERLVFLDGDTMTGRPGKLLLALPRSAAAVVKVRKGVLTLRMDLIVEGQEHGLKVVFPLPAREDGQRVISALQVAEAA